MRKKGAPRSLVAGLALILSAATLGGIYVFLPSLVEAGVARGIQDRLDRGTLPETPAGRFQGARVTMEGL